MEQPPKDKSEAYVKIVGREKYGSSTVSVSKIKEWCTTRQVPPDFDDPFVLHYEIEAESSNRDEHTLRILISTIRLMENMNKSKLVATRAMYKLMLEGLLILMVLIQIGVRQGKEVYPIGIVIVIWRKHMTLHYCLEVAKL